MNLTLFTTEPFIKALKSFFTSLNIPINYITEEPTSAKELLKAPHYKDNDTFKLIDNVYALGIIDDAAFENSVGTAFDKIESGLQWDFGFRRYIEGTVK
ncbi:hypothetical protein DIU31_019220 [Mucilaginibacter rubeus]|uniref:Uncharacterized protein n=1 Tax=Mucilaginibacter rubeus TaxID=2027860 RepID=A0AAE6JH18_9SPHI|nr:MULTISPECIES: hypothetical protein [Mucilaginibacter]QEM05544.1 hypothetical protein DIU31_019220 [Mucilaginibacter rubeus]QEM18131.1 hypothetical protein DIU38_019415 [Mucilaginibacter gossypii]QTE45335.1 hypothetical protein J3L19_08285 [Mucilaginibacter rubeus]QTE51931.1 hypothetical protein J3L21_08265 [Mucilaginibacter rubeus]QTE57019.1 hypothetical protein J3L23_33495 [Mucilaginibacter rubeus]